MNTWFYIKLYLVNMVAFLVIDLTWLGVIARDFYHQQLAHLLAPRTNFPAAILFYTIFVLGLMILAVIPGLRSEQMEKAVLLGALYGFFTYITYDLTNLATLRDWPILLSVIDILWGTLLGTSVAAIGYLVGRWMM